MSILTSISPAILKSSDYFRCIQDNIEELQYVWDDRFASRCRFWRPYVMDVIYRYLECGDVHCGFAKVRCDYCGHEYLLAYSCKRRHFCPSCHQKRVVEYERHPKPLPRSFTYEVDPLVCPKCQGDMRIIAFIEDTTLIQVILKHLGLWETKNHGPPNSDSFHTADELTVDESYAQIPPSDHWLD